MGESPSDKYKRIRQLGLLSAIPLILAAAPLVGYFIGQKIDSVLGTNPVFMFVFLGLGFAAGVRETIHLIRRAEEDD